MNDGRKEDGRLNMYPGAQGSVVAKLELSKYLQSEEAYIISCFLPEVATILIFCAFLHSPTVGVIVMKSFVLYK